MTAHGIYRTMTEIASETIRESILSGVYLPGRRLIPPTLEKELHLSRVAIREALKELVGSGLVTNVPNKGVVVSQAVTDEELEEVFAIRLALEGKACERATERISPREIERLRTLNDDLRATSGSSKEFYVLNRRWHLQFYDASGWKSLCHIIAQLFDRVLVFRNVYPFKGERIPGYIRDHDLMLDAMTKRDAAGAKRILLKHLAKGYESLVEARKKSKGGRNEG